MVIATCAILASTYGILVVGCSRPDPPPAPVATTAPSAAAATSTTRAPSPSAAASAFAIPAPTLERTKVPTVKEWRGGQDTPLLGGAGLGCDGASVREWVRVSCRAANGNGGKPDKVEVVKGAGPEVYVFAKGGVTSVVLRYLPGTDFEASFTWDDGTKFPLAIRWPKDDSRRPLPVGRFAGAPEAPVNTPERRAQCYCFKLSVPGAGSEDVCVGVPADAFVPECTRTHHAREGDVESCSGLLECQWMAPSGYAECLAGEVYSGICPSCRCSRACGPGKPACPDGFECTDNFGRQDNPNVCLPK